MRFDWGDPWVSQLQIAGSANSKENTAQLRVSLDGGLFKGPTDRKTWPWRVTGC